jgi:uroporphyrinogen-III synthase
MKLLVTRPQPQATQWVDALRARGVDAQALPLIGIEPLGGDALHEAWRSLQGCDLVAFVSPNAVSAFFAGRPSDASWPQVLSAATPGPGSAAALRLAGVSLVIEPAADAAQFDSEALWLQLQARPWRRVLIVRGDGGRDWLADQLRAGGADVSQVQAYRRTLPVLDADRRALLEAACAEPALHIWHFSSSQAIDHLEQLAPGSTWSASRAIASHPRIAERARQLGISEVHVVTPSIDAVTTLMQHPHLQSAPP